MCIGTLFVLIKLKGLNATQIVGGMEAEVEAEDYTITNEYMKRSVLLPLINTGTISIGKLAFLRKVREVADGLASSFDQRDLYREAIKILIYLEQGIRDFEVEIINEGPTTEPDINFTASFGLAPLTGGRKCKTKRRGKRHHKTRKFR